MKKLWMKIFLAAVLLGWCAGPVLAAGMATRMVQRDLDGDGRKEAAVFYEGDRIQKMLIDADEDRFPETTVLYDAAGNRTVELTTLPHSEQVVRRVDYYRGQPWKIAEDRNGDGKFDYWVYFKNGVIYKWEEDRNGDGIVDLITFVDAKKVDGRTVLVIKQQDEDESFDGYFERRFGTPTIPTNLPHSLAERLMA